MPISMADGAKARLIHVGKRHIPKKGTRYVLLRQIGPHAFAWFQEEDSEEIKLFEEETIEEAIRSANRLWRGDAFRTVICGFRYTLPERDEHGVNALFCEMAASYSAPNGVYFDQEKGHYFVVQNSSQEALSLLKKLRAEEKL